MYYVIKRNGQQQPADFGKIAKRIHRMCDGLNAVHPSLLSKDDSAAHHKNEAAARTFNSEWVIQQTISQFASGMTTSELDEHAARIAIGRKTDHPNYDKLATRLLVTNLHKLLPIKSFAKYCDVLQAYTHRGVVSPRLAHVDYAFIKDPRVASRLDLAILHDRDFLFDYFGFQTLMGQYLIRVGDQNRVIERPQHLFMREACGVHIPKLKKVSEDTKEEKAKLLGLKEAEKKLSRIEFEKLQKTTLAEIDKSRAERALAAVSALPDEYVDSLVGDILTAYENLSLGRYTHASPTIFGAGTPNPTLTSCYLLTSKDDSIEGIYDTVKQTAVLSKAAGGIGLSVHNIRAQGSYIKGTNGVSNGLGPMLRVFNETARYVDQCFPAGTLVHTAFGAKPIETVEAGKDRVLTDNGTFQNVERLVEHNVTDQKLLSIYTQSMPLRPVSVTEAHQILAVRRQPFKLRRQDLINKVRRGIVKVEYVDANTLAQGDYVVYPIPGIPAPRPYSAEAFAAGERCARGESNNVDLAAYLHSGSHAGEMLWFIKGLLSQCKMCIRPAHKEWVETLRMMLMSFGILARVPTLEGDCLEIEVTHAVRRLLDLPAVKQAQSPASYLRVDNKWLLTPIVSVAPRAQKEEEEALSKLYDFEIAERHTYSTEMGISHNGGGKRKGAFAIYLEPWHADIAIFLEQRKNTGAENIRCRDLFFGLWIPDLFMQRVEEGKDWSLFCPNEAPGLSDVYDGKSEKRFTQLYETYEKEGRARKVMPARDLWQMILDIQAETGGPYLLYKDQCNRNSNHNHLGTIRNSNLCVAPETMILTDQGQVRIDSIVDQRVKVWNGNEWSETTIRKTGENQKLIKVTLSDGTSIDCTSYHRFILAKAGYGTQPTVKNAERVEAGSLKPGMKLLKFKLPPAIEGDSKQNIGSPYTHGLFCADGTYMKGGQPRLTLYGEKKALVPYIDIRTQSGEDDSLGRRNLMLSLDLAPKYKVPMNAELNNKLRWFEGFMDGDGTVAKTGATFSLQAGSIHTSFLRDMQLMLQTMGVASKVTKMLDAGRKLMPDGKGGSAEYATKPVHRLLISSNETQKLIALGFAPKRLNMQAGKPPSCGTARYVEVLQVVDEGRIADTFCFNELKNHAGVFNGQLTGQCSEILQYSSAEEVACCNLASIALPKFLAQDPKTGKLFFDHMKFGAMVRFVTMSLDRVIDKIQYVLPEAEYSNLRHRPMAMGIQGEANVFARLGLPFDSQEAAQLNREIFETMYFNAMYQSRLLAKAKGPYPSYKGSMVSEGKLHQDHYPDAKSSGRWDWDSLRSDIKANGVRNSLLVGPMPTASTSQFLGNNECFEPFTSNMYVRRTKHGEFTVVTNELIEELINRGLWSLALKNKIVANKGLVTGIAEIPQDLQAIYKTSFELSQQCIIDMAVDRSPWVDQSQSLNLYLKDPKYAVQTSMHFYGWKKGLKTGSYYLHTKPNVEPIPVTVDNTSSSSSAKMTQEIKKPSAASTSSLDAMILPVVFDRSVSIKDKDGDTISTDVKSGIVGGGLHKSEFVEMQNVYPSGQRPKSKRQVAAEAASGGQACPPECDSCGS